MSKKKVNAVLIIDGQHDFCDPSGALYVDGAKEDMIRLGQFIDRNSKEIDYIGLTMDSHQVIDIAHPAFWVDKDGNHPRTDQPPFTVITYNDVLTGKWIPRFAPNESIKYIEALEQKGQFPHVIWPEHCIIGTKGSSFVDSIMTPIKKWARTNTYQVVVKGTNPLTEHFGAFEANVPIQGKPETQLNMGLIKTLEEYETVYFAGEAMSHCVANTLKQAMQFPELAKKFVILTDCMSNVKGFEHIADDIYAEAKALGIKFVASTDITL